MFIRNKHYRKHTLESLWPILKEISKKNQFVWGFKLWWICFQPCFKGHFLKKKRNLRFLWYGLELRSPVLIKNSSKNPFKDLWSYHINISYVMKSRSEICCQWVILSTALMFNTNLLMFLCVSVCVCVSGHACACRCEGRFFFSGAPSWCVWSIPAPVLHGPHLLPFSAGRGKRSLPVCSENLHKTLQSW